MVYSKSVLACYLSDIHCDIELERYLAEGWDVQTVLPSGRILIGKST